MRPEDGEAHADEGAVLVEAEHTLDVVTSLGDVEVVATCKTIYVSKSYVEVFGVSRAI